MNKNIYRQADSRWGSLPYPTSSYSFAGNGCGCCACLHVIIEQDQYKNWTPKELRPYMVDKGFATKGNGTTWNGIKLTLEHYGNTVINHATMPDIFKTLEARKKQGQPCFGVILFRAGTKGGITWTAGGHYVAFVDYKESGGKHYFYTKDSGGRHNDGWHCYETTMQGLIPQIWSALPKGKLIGSETTTTKTYSGTLPSPTLKKGSSGAQVKYLQQFLNWWNAYGLVVDGEFGNKTLAAVKDFQKKYGLVVDGIVGPATCNKIKALANQTTTTTTTTSSGYTGTFPNTTLQKGDKGTQVKYLQQFLNWYGNYKLDVDGIFGPKTVYAVTEFQKDMGLATDGIVGIKTRNKMQSVKKKINNTITNPTIHPPVTPKKTVKDKGIDISAWQGNISKANFEKAKNAGVKFVILRLGYTGSKSLTPTIDKVFENNYANAVAAGLPVGVYYYSLASGTTLAKKEAEFVIKNLKGKKITYPVYLDVEDNAAQGGASKTDLALVCDTFCKAINEAGYTAGVYASVSWFNNKIGTITANHTKWVAQYYKECQYKGAYDMWQYSSSETVPGIAEKTDVSWCYKKF